MWRDPYQSSWSERIVGGVVAVAVALIAFQLIADTLAPLTGPFITFAVVAVLLAGWLRR